MTLDMIFRSGLTFGMDTGEERGSVKMGAAELTSYFKDLGGQEAVSTQEKISLDDFANLTGFPVGTIKKELLLEGDEIDLESLREVMLSYLNKSFN